MKVSVPVSIAVPHSKSENYVIARIARYHFDTNCDSWKVDRQGCSRGLDSGTPESLYHRHNQRNISVGRKYSIVRDSFTELLTEIACNLI